MKILLPLPIPYDGNEARYLARDGARFCKAFHDRGIEAVKLLVDDGCGLPPPVSPLLGIASWSQWCSADYWECQAPDGVLLYGGLRSSLEPVVRAIRRARIPVALKMDSANGLLPFPLHIGKVVRNSYYVARQHHDVPLSFLIALLRQSSWLTGVRIRFLCRYLALFDAITVENDFACTNTRLWLKKQGCDDTARRVMVLPHPVPDSFRFSPPQTKQRQIIAVAANWSNPLKGGGLLAQTLGQVLSHQPDFRAIVVGGNSQSVVSSAAGNAPDIHERITAYPILPPEELQPLYSASRILLLASGSEGTPNVATEAVCCGCSVVFPPELRQLSFLSESGSGRMASSRRATSMAAAVLMENFAWEKGERNPVTMSQYWAPRLHVTPQSDRLLSLFGLHPPPGITGEPHNLSPPSPTHGKRFRV